MPLVAICLVWLAGIFVQAGLALPAGARYGLAVTGVLAAGAGLRRRRLRLVGAALLAFALGAGRYQAVVPALDAQSLAIYNDRGWVELEGPVIAEPIVHDERVDLRVRVDSLRKPGLGERTVHGLVLVQAPRYPVYAYGDRLRVSGELETPPESEDFSYKDYLARQGVYSLVQRPRIERLASGQGESWYGALLALKARAQVTLAGLMPEPEASVLTGILLGVDDGIPDSLRSAFSATGTTHLLAISGFNFSILAAALMSIAKRTIGERLGAPLTIGVLLLYAVFVGLSASVVRAAIMCTLVLIAGQLGRQSYTLNSLAFAALVMTALDPNTLWDAGFILSAGATLGLVLYVEPLTALAQRLLRRGLSETNTARVLAVIGDGLIVTTAAQITTTAYIAYTFRRLSLITLLANFLVLPAQPPLELWGIAALLAGLVWRPAGQLLGAVAWLFAAYTDRLVLWFAAWPLASVSFDYVSPAWVWGYYAVLFGFTALPGEWRMKLVDLAKAHLRASTLASGLVVAALLLWSAVPQLPDGRLHVTILQVEDGSAVLIQTPTGKRILVDGGPRASTTLSRLAQRLPWWDRRLDVVIVTSPSAARLNGVLGVLERYEVGYVLTNGRSDTPAWATLVETLAARGIRHSAAVGGQRVTTGDGVELRLLNAAPDDTKGKAFNDDQSLVVRAEYGTVSFLLASDITEKAEERLAPHLQPATVLLAARNGDSDATSEVWLRAVQPSVVVFSAKPDPRTVLPDPEVLERVAEAGAAVWRTDESGSLAFVTDGAVVGVRGER